MNLSDHVLLQMPQRNPLQIGDPIDMTVAGEPRQRKPVPADEFPADQIVIPRVHFITSQALMNRAVAGGIGAEVSESLVVPYGFQIVDFINDHLFHFNVRITDSFGRRWQGDEDRVPLEEWSTYPGNGIFQSGKVNRFMNDPVAEGVNKPGKMVRYPTETAITFEFQKTVAVASTLSWAIMCTCPWSGPYANFPAELYDPDWWKRFEAERTPWRQTVSTSDLDGTVNTATALLQNTGDVLIYGLSYTGAADILVNITNTFYAEPATALTLQPMRIDMLGAIGTNPRAYLWPGGYYLRRGSDLIIEMESLAGPVAIDEVITFWGFAVDWGRYQ